MSFSFTGPQQMALDFPGNVVVSAGAGSGKTRVLVEKYVRLLVDENPDWPVDSVVAITFTRKAAAELQARIIDRVLEELETEQAGSSRWKRLRDVRREVGGAPIGTIHTFCGRLLRQFALDARVDPDYRVVEGAEEQALRLKAARKAISDITVRRDDEVYQDLLFLLNIYSPSALVGHLTDMLANRAAYMGPAERFSKTQTDELYDELVEFHQAFIESVAGPLLRRWAELLNLLVARALPGSIADNAQIMLGVLNNDPLSNWAESEIVLDEALDKIFTRTGTCRKTDFKKAGIEEYDGLRDELEAHLKKYRATALERLGETDRESIRYTRSMARVFLVALNEFEWLRGGMDDDENTVQLLDFTDLEILAGNLLEKGAGVRKEIRTLYKYLILDEFQDTSEVQWNLLRRLVLGEDGQLLPRCLYVVGDRKQGVYGFREANVELFSMVEKLVEQSNEEWNGSRGLITMAANFRTLPEPLGFVNRVFENLLQSAGGKYGVQFDALEVMKDHAPGVIDFICIGSGEEDETGEKIAVDETEPTVCEPEVVALHVKKLLDAGTYKPGDIALLFRKKSLFADYEAALVELGIPCVTQQGGGLFYQPEILDATAALAAVLYPHRDLIFLHYLRCPFIGCPDALLLKIARSTSQGSFYDKTMLVVESGEYRLDNRNFVLLEDELSLLRLALDTIHKAQEMVGVTTLFEVVEYVVNRLEMPGIARGSYRGEQAEANLYKLLATAYSADGLSYEEFLDYIESEWQSVRGGLEESEDLIAPDAVRIMTIHASKGLEFPVVYLANLNSGTGGMQDTVVGDGGRWMVWNVPKEFMPETPFLSRYFRLLDQEKEKAEERRVFYVAMTRCEEQLVLSANASAKARGETFYEWIAEEFEKTINDGSVYDEATFLVDREALDKQRKNRVQGSFQKLGRDDRIKAALVAAKQMQHFESLKESGRDE